MKSGAPAADEIIKATRIANNTLQAGPMTHKKPHGIRSNPTESEYVESILDILDKEMAATGTNPETKDPSNEMDLLVSDLLGYLKIED